MSIRKTLKIEFSDVCIYRLGMVFQVSWLFDGNYDRSCRAPHFTPPKTATSNPHPVDDMLLKESHHDVVTSAGTTMSEIQFAVSSTHIPYLHCMTNYRTTPTLLRLADMKNHHPVKHRDIRLPSSYSSVPPSKVSRCHCLQRNLPR